MGNKSDNAYMYLASSYLGLPDLRPPRGAPIARTHRRPHPIEAGPRSSVSIALPTPDLRLSQLSSRSTPARALALHSAARLRDLLFPGL